MICQSILRAMLCLAIAAGLAAAETKVATAEAIKAAVKKVQPDYNPLAKQMRVQGDVEVEAHISDKGDVVDVKIISGNSLLTPAVVKAVKEWKFNPFQDGGKDSAAIATLRFSFKL